jgi:hypothetical protein
VRPVDVQYGPHALETGQIPAAHFVHVNAHASGFDVDGAWQRERSAISARVAALIHRTGQVVYGRNLVAVAALAIRGTTTTTITLRSERWSIALASRPRVECGLPFVQDCSAVEHEYVARHGSVVDGSLVGSGSGYNQPADRAQPT